MAQRTLAALGGLLLAAQPALAAAPVGDPLAGLQAMRELNAIVLGDTQGWLAVQGKTFVAGDVKNGGEFGIGNAAKGAAVSDRATLTVGGKIQNYTRLQNGANGAAGSVGRRRPVLLARYKRIAPLSNTLNGSPPGPCSSTITGTLLFGLMRRKSGAY